MALQDTLQRKIGPLKAWQWGAVAGMGGLVFLWWRARKAASTAATPTAAASPAAATDPFAGDTSGGFGGGGSGGFGAYPPTGVTTPVDGGQPLIPAGGTGPPVASSFPAGVTVPGLTGLAGFLPGGSIDLSAPVQPLPNLTGASIPTSPLYALSGPGTMPGETADFPTGAPGGTVAHIGNGNPFGTYDPTGAAGGINASGDPTTPTGSYGTGPTGTYGG